MNEVLLPGETITTIQVKGPSLKSEQPLLIESIGHLPGNVKVLPTVVHANSGGGTL